MSAAVSQASNGKRVVAIIQARMTSTRLPGKVLADLSGEPLLQHMLKRVRTVRRLDDIVVATTRNPTDDPVAALCESLDIGVYRGDETDVLGRYAEAAAEAEAEIIVRLTADCPMIEPRLVDEALERFLRTGCDYLSNAIALSWPDGFDTEIFSRATLIEADRRATLPFHREHVTPYMRTGVYDDIPTGDFKVERMQNSADFSHIRLTVDTAEDLDRVRRLVARLPRDYHWMDILSLITRRPKLLTGDGREPGIALRPAREEDARLLHGWANDPDGLKNRLRTSEAIPWDTHLAWLRRLLAAPDAILYIAERDGRPLGQVRAERKGDGVEISLHVDPSARRAGVGLAMLDAIAEHCAARWPDLPLIARIKPDNTPSRRLFARAGYGHVVVARDHLAYRRAPHVGAGS